MDFKISSKFDFIGKFLSLFFPLRILFIQNFGIDVIWSSYYSMWLSRKQKKDRWYLHLLATLEDTIWNYTFLENSVNINLDFLLSHFKSLGAQVFLNVDKHIFLQISKIHGKNYCRCKKNGYF